jgi:HEAT repeat protein
MEKKILVLVSNPKGTTNLDLLPEISRLKEALRRSVNPKRFVVEWEVDVRQANLRHLIQVVEPRIIHFCGHGTEQGLFLEDNTGKAKVVSNEFLTDLLRVFADRIECVVLNACYSENLADQLVQHLNYVIGMNQPVWDDAAIAFTEGFYDALGAGEPYERAFELGKNAVLGKATSRSAPSRKLTAVGEAAEPVKGQNREHLIPVLKINPNPTPIKPWWLAPKEERQAVRDLLAAIASSFNTIQLFHTDQPIVLQDQYIPVQVTLERRYKHSVETIGGYAESEADLKRIYAMRGSSEENIEEEIRRQQVDWQEARRQHSRIMVLADPGMGKSTLLKQEVGTTVQQAYKALEEDKPLQDFTLPLLIRLSTLADEIEAMPTEEAILKIIQERHSNLLKQHENTEVMTFLNAFLKQQLLNGKGLLLLDALDEVPEGKRPKLLEKLNDFAKAYPTCPMVGTSRIVGYGGRLVDGSKDMEIVPFTQKQTEEYIERWFEYAPLRDKSVSARGLIQALRERPQLAGLAQNPLLLSLICSLYQRDQLTLPARRGQIYEQAVSYMLYGWSHDNFRQGSDEARVETKVELLEELAYQFSSQEEETFSLRELRRRIKDYLRRDNATDLDDKTNQLIKELSEQDGILQKLSSEGKQYLFLHRTFQEYLTASYLNHRIEDNRVEGIKCVKQYFWNYDWHETLTLLAGLMDHPMGLIEAIVAEKDDIFQTQLLLAGRCLAECRDLSHPLVDQLIDRIYQFWLAYPDAGFIQSVVVAISQTKLELFQLIQSSLDNVKWTVRSSAAEVLRRVGSERAIDALLQVLSDQNIYVKNKLDGYWNVTNIAANALGQINGDRAINALLQALSSNDSAIRWSVVEALGQIEDETATNALIQSLSDESWSVRSSAAEALGRIGDEKAISALLPLLSDENSFVRPIAIQALGQIGGEKAVDALLQVIFDEYWDIKCLLDQNRYARNGAIQALGWIGGERAINTLLQVLSNKNDFYTAAKALGQSKSDWAVGALIQALSEDSGVKYSAAEALGQIGNKKATDALIQSLSEEDLELKRCAAQALGQIGDEKAVDALIQSLSEEDLELKRRAAQALGQIGDEKAVDALIQSLSEEDLELKRRAAQALGQIGNKKATDALLRVLSDRFSDVSFRCSAAEALGQVRDRKAIDALLQNLSDYNWWVRFSAARALGQMGNERGMDVLIQSLSDANWDISYWAAEALREIRSLAGLEKLLQSPMLKSETLLFSLARSLTIQFSKSKVPFIPIYPELIQASTTSEWSKETGN